MKDIDVENLIQEERDKYLDDRCPKCGKEFDDANGWFPEGVSYGICNACQIHFNYAF
jgi:peptide subunit release factor 1 (eRF1)